MNENKNEFKIDFSLRDVDLEFLKTVHLYKSPDLLRSTSDKYPKTEPHSNIPSQKSVNLFPMKPHPQNPDGKPSEFSLYATKNPQNSQNSSPSKKNTQILFQNKTQNELILKSLLAHSNPDPYFQNTTPLDAIIDELHFEFSQIEEASIIKVVKFNEFGNKTLKYNYLASLNHKFEVEEEVPVPEISRESALKVEAKPRRHLPSSNSSQIPENIDFNEDNLDNFSDAEYSLNNESPDLVDRPEKIRKLMERQLKLGKQEEKFRKKLEGIRSSLQGNPPGDDQADKLNISVRELQMRSQTILEEARRSGRKSSSNQISQSSDSSGKPTDNFVLKFQNYMEQNLGEQVRRSTQTSSESESMNFKSVVSDGEINFDCIKSLNFFFNPHIRSENMMKADYLEYVGLGQQNNGSWRHSANLTGPPRDFLKTAKQSNVVFNEKNEFDSVSVPVEELTHPKHLADAKERDSMFSEARSSSKEADLPFEEDPPSESFDYFKPVDGENNEHGNNDKSDHFNSFKNQKPVYSDYHHYNQGYYQRFYHNYAEDIADINRVPDFPKEETEKSERRLEDQEEADNSQLCEMQSGESERNFKDRVLEFRNEITAEHEGEMPVGMKTESDKMGMTGEAFETAKYFSFTKIKY